MISQVSGGYTSNRSSKLPDKKLHNSEESKAQFNNNLKLNKAAFTNSTKNFMQMDFANNNYKALFTNHTYSPIKCDHKTQRKSVYPSSKLQLIPCINDEKIDTHGKFNLASPKSCRSKIKTQFTSPISSNTKNKTILSNQDSLQDIDLSLKKSINDSKSTNGLKNVQLPTLIALRNIKNEKFEKQLPENQQGYVNSRVSLLSQAKYDENNKVAQIESLQHLKGKDEALYDPLSEYRLPIQVMNHNLTSKNHLRHKKLLLPNYDNLDKNNFFQSYDSNSKTRSNIDSFDKKNNIVMNKLITKRKSKIFSVLDKNKADSNTNYRSYNELSTDKAFQIQKNFSKISNFEEDDKCETSQDLKCKTRFSYFDSTEQTSKLSSSRLALHLRKLPKALPAEKMKILNNQSTSFNHLAKILASPRKMDITEAKKILDQEFDTKKDKSDTYHSNSGLNLNVNNADNQENKNDNFFADNGVEYLNINLENSIQSYFETLGEISPIKNISPNNKKDRNQKNFMPILAELGNNISIIQPEFMKQTGTMCITEFWSEKDKKKYIRHMKERLKKIKIHQSQGNLTLESLYKPEKIKETKEIINKIINQQHAHG